MIRKLTICTALSALMLAAPAHASTLTAVGDSARWSDAISNASAPHPAVCTPLTCRSYDLDLALPPGAWDEPGGLLVSLRWSEQQVDAGYDLDLYLYGPDGDLAAKSDSVIYAAAEGLWLQDAPNGRYRVVVAPRDVVGTSPFELVAATKRGFRAETSSLLLGGGDLTFLGSPPAETATMLPDLVPAEPRNFHIESTLAVNFYQATQRVPAHQPSCYPQETAGLTSDEPVAERRPPLRCLRWDLVVSNAGSGPFELRAYPESATPTTGYQAVYRSDGSYALQEVGGARYSTAHGHVHFRDFDHVGLHRIAPDGSPGELVATMPDKGICTIDIFNRSFGTAADGPSRYRFPGTCDAEDNADPGDPLYPGEPFFRMGLSAGWSDTYPWFIPDQYVDITDVPDGRYLLVYRVNVSGAVAEASRQNNEASACVEFHRTDVAAC